MEDISKFCMLCEPTGNNSFGETVCVTRGLDKIIQTSISRGDNVKELLTNKSSVIVHVKCRKDYTRRLRLAPKKVDTLHEHRQEFDFKSQCIFCAKKVYEDVRKFRKQTSHEYSVVETLEFVENIRTNAEQRNDNWGTEVLMRVSNVIDLVAAEGRYHRTCYKYFLRPDCGKPGTAAHQGRRVDEEKSVAFMKLCKYLEENDECQYAIDEIMCVMSSYESTSTNYSKQYLTRKLKDHYADQITVANNIGKNGVVCFTEHMKDILTDEWYAARKNNAGEDVRRLIETAAMIIRNDIRSQAYDCQVFPSAKQVLSGNYELVPDSLRMLIDGILKPKANDNVMQRKSVSIQHAIVAAVRPRSFVSPIQTGLGVYLHRKYGSRVLIDIVSNLGFCVPYREVLLYEASVTMNPPAVVDPQSYIQFVYDNADYNVATIDGHNTFHSMGGIKCVTPADLIHVDTPIPRTHKIDTDALATQGLSKLTVYHPPITRGYSNLIAENTEKFAQEPESVKTARRLDALWICSAWLQGIPCPNWSGFMSNIYCKSSSYKKSDVLPVPFVNLAPTNPSTIYTCLLNAAEEGEKHGQSMVMVTFDQPLYSKACEMVLAAGPSSPLSRVIVRLGGFHLLMSFLGAIGTIMAGSGLEELWDTVYAKNSVAHMMTGHAYARSLRAHFLTQLALAVLLLESSFTDESIKKDLQTCYMSLLDGNETLEVTANSSVVENITNQLEMNLQCAEAHGRTEKLWVQYFRCITIVKLFIRAERCGDWNLHLHSVKLMLPYLHAAGHLNYAKSAQVYLQQMHKLETVMKPEEFDLFTSQGYFTIRRSDKFWSGIWTDMTIEQVLMRSIKTSGGLTRGRGMKPSVIAKWVRSMPATTSIINVVESVCGVTTTTSEQHTDLRESHQTRDLADMNTFKDWLAIHNPFNRPTPLLTSLSNGIVANEKVNCDNAYAVGRVSMKTMEGKVFSNIHLQRRNNIRSLSTVTKAIRIKDTHITINPNQLFHRIVCVVKSESDLASYLAYELSPRPPSLFNEFSLRKGTKSSLVPVIEALAPTEHLPPAAAVYTLDGGYLLHHVVWQCPATFSQICSQYTSFVKQKYGNANVVFDGYETQSTKDEEHFRRGRTQSSRDIAVENHIQVPISQQEFMGNPKNKMGLIKLLSTHLEAAGCKVHQAEADADRLVATTAIDIGDSGQESVLVGEDTDLLVLLIALAKPQTDIKMMVPADKTHPPKIFNIKRIQSEMGDMTGSLLFLHAITGCDTTSAVYRKGKRVPYKKLKENPAIRQKMQIFYDPNASRNDVAAAGEAFLLVMYGEKPEGSLDKQRYFAYLRTIAKQPVHARFDLATLPPTSAAARQHSYRTFHQVQQWLGNALDPTNWGWELKNDLLKPVTSLKEPVPASLLHLIVCNCRTGCEVNCECRRCGLPCTHMCGYCAGHGCSNQCAFDADDEEYVDECAEEYREIVDADEYHPLQKKKRR